MAGQPGTGKTTFLALLWLAILRGRAPGMELADYQDDRAYLNAIADRLQGCDPALHTELAEDRQLALSLLLGNEREPALLRIPDLSGETWREATLDRQWPVRVEEQVKASCGLLLFLHARDIDAGATIGEVNELADTLETDTSERRDGTESSGEAPAGAGASGARAQHQHTPPTQVALVDALQLICEQRGPGRWRAAIVISAWDLTDRGLTPEEFVAKNLPLLVQYLHANEAWLQLRIFGLSAQGGDFNDRAARVERCRRARDRARQRRCPGWGARDRRLGSRALLMAHEIHQALYGYSDGHGMIAASQPIEPRATRELRTFTDMAFDGVSGHYLTCLPVEALRQQALVRTWPAPESSRAGSVWSHALFIDFVDLGEIHNLQGLLSLFHYPKTNSQGKPLLKRYEQAISISGVTPANPQDARQSKIAENLLVLWAAYGPESASVVSARDPATMETSLMRLWEQQWPRLRRSFSFRTRYRVSSQHVDAFDVQVVERLERDQSRVELPDLVPAWVERLARDLAEPDDDLRTFLRRYGAESANARTELAPLVEINGLLTAGEWASVPPRVWSAFPEGAQMRTLKRALFGDVNDSTELWPAPEPERLRFLLQASPATAADLEDLKLADRLDALWLEKPNQAAKVLAGSYPYSSQLAEELIAASTAKCAPADQIARLAEQQPELVVASVRARPELLNAPKLWSGPRAAREVVAELFNHSDRSAREHVLLHLLREEETDAARHVIEQEPSLWWVALSVEAERLADSPRELEAGSERVRRLLEAAGVAAIGSMPAQLGGSTVLRLLAVTLPPNVGLWRHADAPQWLEVAPDFPTIEPDALRQRAFVVLLSATRLARTPTQRRQLWLVAFAPLHHALLRNELQRSDLEALDVLLPAGASGDPADRLRCGALDAVVRDKWPAHDAQRVIEGAHPFEDLMLATLQSRRKKSKAWLRELVDQLIS
jgi:Double-GTPase 1/GTPase-associated protein 1, N-terminal domain type 1